jgi:hypothetical protein
MKKTTASRLCHRRQCGQALAEGAAALVMIIAFTIGAILLALNSAVSVFYKEKLAFMSNQAAQFASTLPPTINAGAATKDYLSAIMPGIGLRPRNLTVKVDKSITIAGRPAAAVTISNDCNLFGSGSILPLFVRMTDSGLATSATTASSAAGPPGPAGVTGPPGPPGSSTAVKYDPQALKTALNITGTMRLYDDDGNAIYVPISGPNTDVFVRDGVLGDDGTFANFANKSLSPDANAQFMQFMQTVFGK